MHLIVGGGGGINKALVNAESTLAGIVFAEIEAYTGMAERLARYLATEEALKD